ncbi:MAG TPA: M20/M25/M40 family metallo-hydrolase [Gaiellaceae bacterium]|nr:M20/M25/M40 family metallo-hydrolase [Gaiellaceae bacterium]
MPEAHVPPDHLRELCELLAIPSVSADPTHADDVRAACAWVCARVEAAGGEAEVAGGGHLGVGRLRASVGRGAPLVILYGHVDVQPPEPLHLWETPPFEAVVRDGWLHARGATDDKGQFYVLLRAALDLARAGELPVDVLVLADGEEEVGGAQAWHWLREHAAGADAAIAFDGPAESGEPELMLATRGLLSVDVTVETGAVDLHSGHYGGVALNAVNALLETLAAVLPREGVLRDELRVGVEPPSQEELASWARLAPGAAQLERRGARPLPVALDAYHARRWAEPSLDLNGVLGGKPGRRNTSIPVRAQAELSLRLVPDQRVEEVGAVVERLLRDAAPAGATLGVRWEGVPPARVPAEHPAVRLAAAALERALGAPPRLVRSGGTMPVVAAFAELGIPALLVPLGVPEGNQHAPNERLPLEALPRGLRVATELLRSLGGARPRRS